MEDDNSRHSPHARPEADRGRGDSGQRGPARRGPTWTPALTLFLLAPVIGELVGAALRLSYLGQPLRVLAILCYYGAGVLLIRETAVRLRLNHWGVVLLGIGYALIEEGLGLQTIFNPVGMDGETVGGRFLGVNWFWGVVVGGYHVVWSVVIPIALVQLTFPAHRGRRWLSGPALGGCAALYVLGAALFALISTLRSDFRLSPWQITGVLVLTLAVVWLAIHRRRPFPARPMAVGVGRTFTLALGSGLVWFLLHLVAFIGDAGSFLWWTIGAIVTAVTVGWLLHRSVTGRWEDRHTLAACSGAILAEALFGLLLVALGNVPADVVFQVLLTALLLLALVLLRKRLGA